MKKALTILIFLAFTIHSMSQVGIGTTSPAASAQLDVSSTKKGFLPPRMTSAQRDSISKPEFGLVIYNATSDNLQVYKKGTESLNINQSLWNMTNPAPAGVYQSFIATASGVLGSVDLVMQNPSSTLNSTVYVRIYAGAGISGTLLATSQIVTPTNGYDWNKFTFLGPGYATLTSGQTYTILLTPIGSFDRYTWIGIASDVYANGQAGFPGSGFYQPYDLPFKTYLSAPSWVNL